MLSTLVITFLPRSKCLSISWLQSPSAVILEPKKIKSVTVSTCFPSICHEVVGPIFWPPDAKNWPIGKYSDAGKDWRQEEKGMTENEMVGWHHQHNGHGFGWTPGVGQGGLACCNSWGHIESDTTEWLNWTELWVLASLIYICISLYIIRHTDSSIACTFQLLYFCLHSWIHLESQIF